MGLIIIISIAFAPDRGFGARVTDKVSIRIHGLRIQWNLSRLLWRGGQAPCPQS